MVLSCLGAFKPGAGRCAAKTSMVHNFGLQQSLLCDQWSVSAFISCHINMAYSTVVITVTFQAC